eukprot:1203970-Pleurochrysis_carterae.AAC.3
MLLVRARACVAGSRGAAVGAHASRERLRPARLQRLSDAGERVERPRAPRRHRRTRHAHAAHALAAGTQLRPQLYAAA